MKHLSRIKHYLLIIAILLYAPIVYGAPVSFSWTPNQPPTDGYKLWEIFEDGTVTQIGDDIVGIDQATITIDATVPPDDKCRTYALTAFYGDDESDYSQTAAWCPPYEKNVPLFFTRPPRPSAPGVLNIEN